MPNTAKFTIFAKILAMKKLTLLFALFSLFALTSCENPSKSRVYTEEGSKLLLRYSQYEEAEEVLTKAISYDKHNYEAYYYRGCAKANAQKFEAAIVDFEKAVELKPDYADAYFNMGRVYHMQNDDDKACEYYKLADKYGRPNLEDYLKRCN